MGLNLGLKNLGINVDKQCSNSNSNKKHPKRCNSTKNLEVHHRRRDGGNGIDNAEVLCQDCHAHTATYGTPGKSPAPFDEETKKEALERAGGKCECTRSNCHDKNQDKDS